MNIDLQSHSGTLVTAIPTKSGLLMSADSRTTVAGRFLDSTFKLTEVRGPHATVISVVGISVVTPAPPAGVDPLTWATTAPPVLDIVARSREHLEAANGPFTREVLEELGAMAVAQMNSLVEFAPDAPQAYAGNNFCGIVVGSYDPEAMRSVLGLVGTRFNPSDGNPETTFVDYHSFDLSSTCMLFEIGLFEYLNDHVFVQGRKYAERYLAFRSRRRTVKDTQLGDALDATIALQHAAERTSRIVPAPVGVGGPTDIVVLGPDPAPRRLRWKA